MRREHHSLYTITMPLVYSWNNQSTLGGASGRLAALWPGVHTLSKTQHDDANGEAPFLQLCKAFPLVPVYMTLSVILTSTFARPKWNGAMKSEFVACVELLDVCDLKHLTVVSVPYSNLHLCLKHVKRESLSLLIVQLQLDRGQEEECYCSVQPIRYMIS